MDKKTKKKEENHEKWQYVQGVSLTYFWSHAVAIDQLKGYSKKGINYS